jgi:hypothetical protein
MPTCSTTPSRRRSAISWGAKAHHAHSMSVHFHPAADLWMHKFKPAHVRGARTCVTTAPPQEEEADTQRVCTLFPVCLRWPNCLVVVARSTGRMRLCTSVRLWVMRMGLICCARYACTCTYSWMYGAYAVQSTRAHAYIYACVCLYAWQEVYAILYS